MNKRMFDLKSYRPLKVFLFPNADMDQNSEVNITDALKVVDVILGKEV
jgi:hypothetical protein